MENFEQGRKFSTSKSLHVFCKYNAAFIVLCVSYALGVPGNIQILQMRMYF